MESLDIFLLVLAAVIGFSITKEIFAIRTSNMNKEEANRFFNNMSNAENENPSIKASVYTRGLTLAKSKKDDKYDLIPQSKLCDLGLS